MCSRTQVLGPSLLLSRVDIRRKLKTIAGAQTLNSGTLILGACVPSGILKPWPLMSEHFGLAAFAEGPSSDTTPYQTMGSIENKGSMTAVPTITIMGGIFCFYFLF